MAFIVKKDRGKVRLIRRSWVSKKENTYTIVDVNLGSLPATATELPSGFPEGHEPLSEKEMAALEQKVFGPAKALAEKMRIEAEERAMDPMRRVEIVRPVLLELSQLSRQRPVCSEVLRELNQLLTSVTGTESPDPLENVLHSVEAAVAAIDDGCYGIRPEKISISETDVSRRWRAVRSAMDNLRSALQRTRWVKQG